MIKKINEKKLRRINEEREKNKKRISMKLLQYALTDLGDIFEELGSNVNGLKEKEVLLKINEQGLNEIRTKDKNTLLKKIANAFINPFTIVLSLLALVSFITDYLIAAVSDKDLTTVTIILTMVLISGLLRIIQEGKSNKAGEKLNNMIKTTCTVIREGNEYETEMENLVCGDIVKLAAGDMIPADIRIITAKDLFISEASMTGESEPVEKMSQKSIKSSNNPLDYENLAFMGTNVISGSAIGIVISTGDNTLLGTMAESLNEKRESTSFDKGVNSVSFVLIKFMAIMVPVVFFINGLTKGDWMDAFLFGISIAVGLTPEMLPMIVTTNLAKGAVKMAKSKTIVKNLNSIQNFGAMDVLCTDKTGTLTEDKIILERYLDIHGNEDIRVLKHGYLVSAFQTGLKNLLDVAILEHGHKDGLKDLENKYVKVDEIPFDFTRRRMSVVLKDKNKKTQLITKGAVEEMLQICSFAEYKGEVCELTKEIKDEIVKTAEKLNENGMRVIAVAQKNNPSSEDNFSVKDEINMVLMGYIAFLDPPKESTIDAIEALKKNGVEVKVLTGDNEKVTKHVCSKVNINVNKILLGTDIENMSDDELKVQVEKVNIFAKLSPSQKERIVGILRSNGHVVGFMGDGINDAAAMRKADVGISVDTAVDIAKESADIILLEKNLMVLEKGVIEGRKTFANIIKYIKMTASSNFGNMFSVLVASAFLPFLPMLPAQLLVLNLIYDISCISIPWDNVDEEFLKVPRKWNADSIGSFMKWIGPTSSVFDIITYIVMFFIICPMVSGGNFGDANVNTALFIATFNAGWFIESLWSQTLVIHMIRTPKLPFIQSRSSFSVLVCTTVAIFIGTIIPYTKFGTMLGMNALPLIYFAALIVIILSYMILVTIVKKIYIKKNGELL
ncbi:magnesium-translocating P-type ATPase [Clostridium botulinum]|uniref:magnesium-translocating P-type ATPase n=1 Tax=Clostridium botulinum TaxID=1491 RepID=UPI00077409F9|nr:magnesium-translocating P-type ATPase [Clostridium botulinum]NFH78676.1 magnesium-translocating P-type ATPase [Clostridium botulinum]NFH83865.1 magnesium-translocating P-type ATPase [Clostridium botulinum]NFI10667.1 magnesium-translocating P-type ATPase [Clostridium botulinum]NFI13222.1 magnesium-translocating P-type ATPase [Clostridium botulinum]NFO82940.1 magnesium-translocating P-type ATPase [Clostridium botulinum]